MQISSILGNIDDQVRQYLMTKTLISGATGVLTSLVLWILGVDFALLWGFLAFLLNFIPNIGSVISTLLPFSLSLLQFESLTIPVLVLALLGTIQVSMGNVVEPKVMSFSLNLSALVILISLIFWGWLWGIWGMILAVPFTATLKIVFENIEPLRPISVLMSGVDE
jgi:predicted PurR-regulated permease PerM